VEKDKFTSYYEHEQIISLLFLYICVYNNCARNLMMCSLRFVFRWKTKATTATTTPDASSYRHWPLCSGLELRVSFVALPCWFLTGIR